MSFLHLTLTLDPVPCELNPRLPSARSLPGARFFTLAEVPDDETCRQHLYHLVREGVLDDPGHGAGFESYGQFYEKIYPRCYRDHAATQFLATSLKKNGLRLDLSRWPLLEQPAPDLCADRIDYTLQDRIHYDQMDKQSISKKTGQRVSAVGRIRVLSKLSMKKV